MKKPMIKTYCYGKLKEFTSIKKAMDFYFEACNGCEGAERDRYLDIYSKLACNHGPFCDCDGVPATEKKEEPKNNYTEKDVADFHKLIADKHEASDRLDALRAEYAKLEAEFKRQNAKLISDISKTAERWNTLAIREIHYNKLGLRA